jgi:hypothetical protein
MMYLQNQKNSSEMFFVRRREHSIFPHLRLVSATAMDMALNQIALRSCRMSLGTQSVLSRSFGNENKDTIKFHRQEAQFELNGPKVVLCVLR